MKYWPGFFCVLFLGVFSAHYAFAQKTKSLSSGMDVCSYVKNPDTVRSPDRQRGAAYEGGIDVHGNSVAPADLHSLGTDVQGSDGIEIPIELDLIKRFNLDVPGAIALEPTIAMLKIGRDGRVLYNGRDISQELSVYCTEGQAGEQASDSSGVSGGPTQSSADKKKVPATANASGTVTPFQYSGEKIEGEHH